jgi:RmlD substrate binding domain
VKIMHTGPTGQVGWELAPLLAPLGELVTLDRAALDLADARWVCSRRVWVRAAKSGGGGPIRPRVNWADQEHHGRRGYGHLHWPRQPGFRAIQQPDRAYTEGCYDS